jgi:hypothetical protein
MAKKDKSNEKKILIAIRKDLLIKIITETRSNLINYSYFLAIDM